MKWRRPKTGHTRVVKKFAFFPITALCLERNGKSRTWFRETRWLCFCKIKQRYNLFGKWVNDYFID